MRKRLLTVLGASMALVVALSLSVSASDYVFDPWRLSISAFPEGLTKLPEAGIISDDPLLVLPTVGIQIGTSDSFTVGPVMAYNTSFRVLDHDLELSYEFTDMDEIQRYATLYYRFWFGYPVASASQLDVSIKSQGLLKSYSLHPGSEVQSLGSGSVGDYYTGLSVLPSGDTVTFRFLNEAAANRFSYFQISQARNTLWTTFTIKVTIHDILNDYSATPEQLDDVNDLFDSFPVNVLSPAVGVLSFFWNVPFIRYSMIGFGVVGLYAFIVRLF